MLESLKNLGIGTGSISGIEVINNIQFDEVVKISLQVLIGIVTLVKLFVDWKKSK